MKLIVNLFPYPLMYHTKIWDVKKVFVFCWPPKTQLLI